jgi:hypothetical protein
VVVLLFDFGLRFVVVLEKNDSLTGEFDVSLRHTTYRTEK